MRTRRCKRAVCAGLVSSLVAGVALDSGAADSDGAPEVIQFKKMLDEQARLLAEQKRVLERQEAELVRQKRELRELRENLNSFAGQEKIDKPDLAKTRGAGSGGQIAQAPAAPVGQAPQPATRPPAVAPITDAVAVLTQPGKFVLEPSLQYAHSSNSRVALVGFTIIPAITIGLIDIRSVNRDLWTAALTGRYGVNDRLELEAKVPWVYRQDSTLARPLATPSVADSMFDTSGRGLGDIELAARYQITQRPPFYIGYLRFKTHTGDGPFDVATSTPVSGLTIENTLPTGTGFYSLQPGITALVPSDPAVFFGGLSYIWNIKRDISAVDSNGTPVGNYDPGDGVNFNFGMGLSINDRASFSLGYDHTTFFKDKRNGETLQNAQTQQVGSLLFGLSYRISPRTNVNLTLGVGATSAAPDVQLTARIPMTF